MQIQYVASRLQEPAEVSWGFGPRCARPTIRNHALVIGRTTVTPTNAIAPAAAGSSRVGALLRCARSHRRRNSSATPVTRFSASSILSAFIVLTRT